MLDSIQRIIHRIRTTYKESEISYGGDDIGKWENFPQRMLNGNDSETAIWTVLSSVIVDILHKRGFGFPFSSVIWKSILLLVEFSYGDD